jgi:hypothetical protein
LFNGVAKVVPKRPEEVWVADITYLQHSRRWRT